MFRAQNDQRESRPRTQQHLVCLASESFDANGNPPINGLTNAFSKKLENHIHALSIYFMHYNFVRIHQTLRVTPALAAGVTDTRMGSEPEGLNRREKERASVESFPPARTPTGKGGQTQSAPPFYQSYNVTIRTRQ